MTFILTKLKEITSKTSLWAELDDPNAVKKIHEILESSIPSRTFFEKWLACKDHILSIMTAYYSNGRKFETKALYMAIAKDTILTENQWFIGQDKFWNPRKDSRKTVETAKHNTPSKEISRCILRLSNTQAFEAIPKDLQEVILNQLNMRKGAWKKENFTIQTIENDLHYLGYYIDYLDAIHVSINIYLAELKKTKVLSSFNTFLLKDYLTVMTKACKVHLQTIENPSVRKLIYYQDFINQYIVCLIYALSSLTLLDKKIIQDRLYTEAKSASDKREKYPVCTIIQCPFVQETDLEYLVLINDPNNSKQTALLNAYLAPEKSDNNKTSKPEEITRSIMLKSSESISANSKNRFSIQTAEDDNDANEEEEKNRADIQSIYSLARESNDKSLLSIIDNISNLQYGVLQGVDFPKIFAEIYCCGHFQAIIGQYFPGAGTIALENDTEDYLAFTPRQILLNLSKWEIKHLQKIAGSSCPKLQQVTFSSTLDYPQPTISKCSLFTSVEIFSIKYKLADQTDTLSKQLQNKLKSNLQISIESWYNQNAEEDAHLYLAASQQLASNRKLESIVQNKTSPVNSAEISFSAIIFSINETHEIFHPKDESWKILIKQARLPLKKMNNTSAFIILEHYPALLLTDYISAKLTIKQKVLVLYALLTDLRIDNTAKQAISASMGFIHLSDAENALKSYYEKEAENIVALNELVKKINAYPIRRGMIIRVGKIISELKKVAPAKLETAPESLVETPLKFFSKTDLAHLGVESYNTQKIADRMGGSKIGSARGFAYQFLFEAILAEEPRLVVLYALLICNEENKITQLQKHVVASICNLSPVAVTQVVLDTLKTELNLYPDRIQCAETIRGTLNQHPTFSDINNIIQTLPNLLIKSAKEIQMDETESEVTEIASSTTDTHYTQSQFLFPPSKSIPNIKEQTPQQPSENITTPAITLRSSGGHDNTS